MVSMIQVRNRNFSGEIYVIADLTLREGLLLLCQDPGALCSGKAGKILAGARVLRARSVEARDAHVKSMPRGGSAKAAGAFTWLINKLGFYHFNNQNATLVTMYSHRSMLGYANHPI